MVEASVKLTHTGAHPEVASGEKEATGNGNTVIVTVAVAPGEQPSVAVTV